MSRCQPWRRGPMLARLQWICPVSRELTPAGHRGPLTGSRRRASLSHNVRDSHNNPPGTRRAHYGQRPSAVARQNGLVRLSGPPANQRRPRYQQVVKFIAKDVEQSHSAKASAPGETRSRYNALKCACKCVCLRAIAVGPASPSLRIAGDVAASGGRWPLSPPAAARRGQERRDKAQRGQ